MSVRHKIYAAVFVLLGLCGCRNDVHEISRVRSADGALDAVVSITNPGGGATVGYFDEVYILPRGGMLPNKFIPFIPARGRVFVEDQVDETKVRWDGPAKLIISAKATQYARPEPKSVRVFDGAKKRRVALAYEFTPQVK